MRQILHFLPAFFKGEAMIGEIRQRETAAAVAELVVQFSQQVVGLGHGIEIARGLFRLDERVVLAFCPIAGLWMRTHQMQDNQLRLGAFRFQHLRGHF